MKRYLFIICCFLVIGMLVINIPYGSADINLKKQKIKELKELGCGENSVTHVRMDGYVFALPFNKTIFMRAVNDQNKIDPLERYDYGCHESGRSPIDIVEFQYTPDDPPLEAIGMKGSGFAILNVTSGHTYAPLRGSKEKSYSCRKYPRSIKCGIGYMYSDNIKISWQVQGIASEESDEQPITDKQLEGFYQRSLEYIQNLEVKDLSK